MSMSCFGGAMDGEHGWHVSPTDCDGIGRVYLSQTDDFGYTREGVYQVAWRWTQTNGYEGIVLALASQCAV